MTAFGKLLREYRQRAPGTPSRWNLHIAGMSQNELAKRAGIDVAYINRMESGKQPAAPSRNVVELLAAGLELGPAERDRLLILAGYWPWRLDPTALDAVVSLARLLEDRSESVRQEAAS